MTTTIPINTLTPHQPPAASTCIRAIITLSWPYSSATRQCALLLSDPDFRLRRQRGQIRVRFTGPSAEAVAKARVGIGDEVVLGLEGGKWEDDPVGEGTPGRGVEGEMWFAGRLDMRVRREGGGEEVVRVDEPEVEEQERGRDGEMDKSRAGALETPAPKGVADLRRRVGGVREGLEYASPAFAKRLRLDANEDPFGLEAPERNGRLNGQRLSFGGNKPWRYVERTPSPVKENFAATDATPVRQRDDAQGLLNGSEGERMLPPPLPRLEVPADSEAEAPSTVQQQERPSTPKLLPVKSPTLPLPSPFPTDTPKIHFGTSGLISTADSPTRGPATNRNDVIQPNTSYETQPDEEVTMQDVDVVELLSDTEPDTDNEEMLESGQPGPATEMDYVHDKEDDEMLEPNATLIEVVAPHQAGEAQREAVDAEEVEGEDDGATDVQDQHTLPLGPKTPEQPQANHRLGLFGFDGASSAPSSAHVTPQSEKDRIMARTYRSLFGFRGSPEATRHSFSPEFREYGLPVPDADIIEDLVHEEPVPEQPRPEDPVPPEEPVLDGPLPDGPVFKEAVPDEPDIDDSALHEPILNEAVLDEPVLNELTSAKIVPDQSGVEESVTNETFADEASAEEPIVEYPDGPTQVRRASDQLFAADLGSYGFEHAPFQAVEEAQFSPVPEAGSAMFEAAEIEDINITGKLNDLVPGSGFSTFVRARLAASDVHPEEVDGVSQGPAISTTIEDTIVDGDDSAVHEEAAVVSEGSQPLAQPSDMEVIELSSDSEEESEDDVHPPRAVSFPTAAQVDVEMTEPISEYAPKQPSVSEAPDGGAAFIESQNEVVTTSFEDSQVMGSVSADNVTQASLEAEVDELPDASVSTAGDHGLRSRTSVDPDEPILVVTNSVTSQDEAPHSQFVSTADLLVPSGTHQKSPTDVATYPQLPILDEDTMETAQPQSVQTTSYPSLPLSPSNSQSLQDMPSQSASFSLLHGVNDAVLPPTPQLTQGGSTGLTAQMVDDGLSDEQHEEDETADDNRNVEQATETELRTSPRTDMKVQIDTAMGLHAEAIPEQVSKDTIDNEQGEQNNLPNLLPTNGDVETNSQIMSVDPQAGSERTDREPTRKSSRILSKQQADKGPMHSETEVKTPQPEKKTPARKSMSTRLSIVPASISAWFSPKQSNGRADADGEQSQHAMTTRKGRKDTSQQESDFAPDTPVHSNGVSTALSYFTPLSRLDACLNPSSSQSHGAGTVDIFAVVTDKTKEPARAKGGPRDYYTIFRISDTSIQPTSSVRVEVFRPWKATLPVAEEGDVVLLRDFVVKSRKRQAYLLSTDASAWCVWRYEGAQVVASNSKKPAWARKATQQSGSAVREEVKGPPVELGEGEREHARGLRSWWEASLDAQVQVEHDDADADAGTLNGHVPDAVAPKL